MERLVWRERPAMAVLTVVGCIAFGGLMSQVLFVIGASALARMEHDGNHRWFLAPTVLVQAQMQKVESRSSLMKEMIKAAPTQLVAKTTWGRDLDRRSMAEFYLMFYLALFGWCFLTIANFAFQICFNWRLSKAWLSRIREQQMGDRPEGSTYSKFAEWLLYASSWEEYSAASDLAEALRDRYESDWKPAMGPSRANRRYVYEVIRALAGLHETTGRRFERRIAGN